MHLVSAEVSGKCRDGSVGIVGVSVSAEFLSDASQKSGFANQPSALQHRFGKTLSGTGFLYLL